MFRASAQNSKNGSSAVRPFSRSRRPFDEGWTERQRKIAVTGLERSGFKAYMETRFSLAANKPNIGPRDLLKAAESAEIHAFGWPIGVVLNREDAAPKPRADGIAAEIVAETSHRSYDYWALRRDGDFYLLHTLFEDSAKPEGNVIFVDSRIVRVTETLLYCRRLYDRLGVSPATDVNIEIVHAGIAGRVLGTADPRPLMFMDRRTGEDRVVTRLQVPLLRIESDLTALVGEFMKPLFELFDFFELTDKVLAEIVDGFVAEVKRRG